MSNLFEQLRALRLPSNDYVIFGSGPLVIRGIIAATNDLDMVCRGAAWEAVCRLAPPQRDPRWDVELVSLHDGALTFGTAWAASEADPEEVIDSAEVIGGLPFARLEYVVDYKKALGRPKDLAHLRALERFGRGDE